MNASRLVAALRSRSPNALPELLDAYSDLLFTSSWCLLRNREHAQIAVPDALVALPRKSGSCFAMNVPPASPVTRPQQAEPMVVTLYWQEPVESDFHWLPTGCFRG
jgi:hypothetical protein